MLGFSNTWDDILPHRQLPPPPVALTIAGHDPSTGAGITADLQAFSAHGVFGTSVITALTVQSTLGVAAISPVPKDVFRQTLEHLRADLPPLGVKIGMLGTKEILEETIRYLQRLLQEPSKPMIPIVLDPVLRSSSGATLLDPVGLEVMRSGLLPLVDWITPNWSELAVLTGEPVSSLLEVESAACLLGSHYPHLYVVVTGGDQATPTDLLRLPSGEIHYVPGEHIPSTSTHGTGCAFSSALLSEIILGKSPIQAVISAKSYVTESIRSAPGIGHGRGAMNLLWPLTRS
jgi:hydroxymethylpyrimidine/phosphomethylpyrimidine kinase